MRRLYAVRFDVEPPSRDHGLVTGQTLDLLWAWVCGGEPPVREWTSGRWQLRDRSLIAGRIREGGTLLYRAMATVTSPEAPSVSWRWVADLACTDERLDFGLVLDVIGMGSSLPVVPTPEIVRNLVGAGARSGPVALAMHATEITGKEHVHFLANDWLLSDDRRIPVVAFSTKAGSTSTFAVGRDEIDRFAETVAGHARVVCLSTETDAALLSDRLPDGREIADGVVRVYRPSIRSGAHPLYRPLRLTTFTLRDLARTLRFDAARNYRVPPGVSAVAVDHTRAAKESPSISRLKTAQDLDATIEEYGRQIDRLMDVIAIQDQKLAAKDAEVSEREVSIAELEDRVAHLDLVASSPARRWEVKVEQVGARRRVATSVLERLDAIAEELRIEIETDPEAAPDEVDLPLPERPEEPVPDSITEVLLWAAEQFGGTLVITKDAEDIAMLQLSSASVPLDRLWSALCSMDEVATRWQRGEAILGGIENAMADLGFHVGHTSTASLGRYGHEYSFTYQGTRVHVNEHIRLSRRHRLYWYTSVEERRFVINHIGIHLPTTSD